MGNKLLALSGFAAGLVFCLIFQDMFTENYQSFPEPYETYFVPLNADSLTPEEMAALAPKGMKVRVRINPEEKILLTYVYAGDDNAPNDQETPNNAELQDTDAAAKAQDVVEDDPGEAIDGTDNDTAAS